jgi:hypothetical protein
MADVDAKPSGRRLWLILIGVLAVVAFVSSRTQKPSPQTAASDATPQAATDTTPKVMPDTLAAQAVASVKREPTWQEIKVDTAKPSDYSLTLVYKPAGIPPLAIVERDTTTIARAMLKTLVAASYQPQDIQVSVFAQMPGGKGETGQNLVIPFGWTRYDHASDQFKFKRWTDR